MSLRGMLQPTTQQLQACDMAPCQPLQLALFASVWPSPGPGRWLHASALVQICEKYLKPPMTSVGGAAVCYQ